MNIAFGGGMPGPFAGRQRWGGRPEGLARRL